MSTFSWVCIVIQWVCIAVTIFFVRKSFQITARSKKNLAETKASLAKMEELNQQLNDLHAGMCCKCGLQIGLQRLFGRWQIRIATQIPFYR